MEKRRKKKDEDEKKPASFFPFAYTRAQVERSTP